MRAYDEILSDVTNRHNPRTGGNGLINRLDIYEVMSLGTKEDREENVRKFLDDCPFVDEKLRKKLLSGLDSYPYED